MHQTNDIRFPNAPMADFFPTLRGRIADYFKTNDISKYGNRELFVKTILLFGTYFGAYFAIMSNALPGWLCLLLCMVIGFAGGGLGMSVMHDALHQSYSSNKIINQWMSITMEILGGSSFTWKIQHNVLHHTFTNVYGIDEDIEDKPFLRLSPSGKRQFIHRFQHIYAVFLYALSNFSWVTTKDFRQLQDYFKTGLAQKAGARYSTELSKMILSKSLFIIMMVILPLWWLNFAWYWVLLGFSIVLMVEGIILTTVFLTAHAVEIAEHIQPDETGNMESNWAIHQLRTTANFNTNRLFSWYVGGLNYQIEHHLFPHISHVHYPQIANIVRATAKEFNLPYFQNPSFRSALYSHFKYLWLLGNTDEAKVALHLEF
jgi:linoleoyl-CoA desaturase